MAISPTLLPSTATATVSGADARRYGRHHVLANDRIRRFADLLLRHRAGACARLQARRRHPFEQGSVIVRGDEQDRCHCDHDWWTPPAPLIFMPPASVRLHAGRFSGRQRQAGIARRRLVIQQVVRPRQNLREEANEPEAALDRRHASIRMHKGRSERL